MEVFLILGRIIAPALMIILQRKWFKFRSIFHVAAILSALIFGNIASISIHQIIENQTVFMTNIHALFLNPLFLLAGAYLGVYLSTLYACFTYIK
ncbi:transposase [Peribacillus asahii]|uniref:transposase n=1 Tax=Peribacillus asahii TaxID=228899 RepID=UPI00207A6B45|nr:transposase [Peribacillus asahii]USK59615.1 transposase [Peribacillus asahii]